MIGIGFYRLRKKRRSRPSAEGRCPHPDHAAELINPGGQLSMSSGGQICVSLETVLWNAGMFPHAPDGFSLTWQD